MDKGEKFEKLKTDYKIVKNSYIARLISKVLSFFLTIILIMLIILGALMFYYNSQAKSYEKKGLVYSPPFGLYTIVSGSMMPKINVYDVIVAVNIKDPETVKVGDIITYISNWDLNYGLNVTHRVVDINKNEQGEYTYITKGDNNKEVDGAPVPQSNVIGKVILRIPQLGRLQFLLATKMGWFIIVFIPAVLVIIYDLIKLLKLAFIKNKVYNVDDVKIAEFKDEPQPENLVEPTNENIPVISSVNEAEASLPEIDDVKNENEDRNRKPIRRPINRRK